MPSASLRTVAYRGSHGLKAISAQEGRVLGDHDVARVEHQAAREVQPLLAAVDDEDVVGGAADPVAAQPLRDLRPENRQAHRRGVLQGGGMLGDQELGEHLGQLRDGEQRRVGVAAAEADHLGVGAQPEQLPDR
jgi:hypothetical protein